MEPEGGRVEPKLSLSESGDTLRGHSRIVVAQLSCVEAVWGNRSLFGCFDIFLMQNRSSYPKCEMICPLHSPMIHKRACWHPAANARALPATPELDEAVFRPTGAPTTSHATWAGLPTSSSWKLQSIWVDNPVHETNTSMGPPMASASVMAHGSLAARNSATVRSTIGSFRTCPKEMSKSAAQRSRLFGRHGGSSSSKQRRQM